MNRVILYISIAQYTSGDTSSLEDRRFNRLQILHYLSNFGWLTSALRVLRKLTTCRGFPVSLELITDQVWSSRSIIFHYPRLIIIILERNLSHDLT